MNQLLIGLLVAAAQPDVCPPSLSAQERSVDGGLTEDWLRRAAYCDPERFLQVATDDDKIEATAWWVQWLLAHGHRQKSLLHARALSLLCEDDKPEVAAVARDARSWLLRRY